MLCCVYSLPDSESLRVKWFNVISIQLDGHSLPKTD